MNASPPSTLRLLWQLGKYQTWLYLLCSLLWTIIHVLPVFVGLFIKGIFDALAGESSLFSAWTFLAFLALLDLTRISTMVGGTWNWSRYWLEITLLLRHNMLHYLLTAPGARRQNSSPSEAISVFRDDVEDIALMVENWVDFWGLAGYAIVALAIMLTIDPLMTLLACLPLGLSLLLTQLLRPYIRKTRYRMRKATGHVTDFIGELFNAVQAVKVSGKKEAVLGHFQSLNTARHKAALRDSLLTEGFKSITDNMVSIAIGLILLLAASALREGQFTVGDFALFVTYMPRLTSTITFMGAMFVQHKRTGVSFERIQHLLQDAAYTQAVAVASLPLHRDMPSFKLDLPKSTPLEDLAVKNLSYQYPDGNQGIKDISFTIKRGSFTVITGRIGSGKSTLLRVLLGLLPKDQGDIYWNDERVKDPASFFIPPRSAYTAQVPKLFSDTLRENVVTGKTERHLKRAIKLSVLEPDIAHLERGLDTLVGSRGVKLSGGQMQRSASARMFMQKAELLVFDDVSSALDVKTENQLWEGIFQEGQATCLVVSHRQAALQRADQILVLKDGRLVASGKLADLLEHSEEMKHLGES